MTIEIIRTIDSIAESDWNRCLPGELESWGYYRAVERAGLEGFEFGYVCVRRGAAVLAFAPFFVSRYRLDTTGTGAIKSMLTRLSGHLPDLLSIPMICLGSPVSEICHVGYAPEIAQEQRPAILRRLVDALGDHARSQRIGLIGVKDAAGAAVAGWDTATTGFTRLPGMPSSVLALPFATLDDYLSSLPNKLRKDLRRKMRGSEDLVIEQRHNVDDVLPEIMQLYEQTRSQSDLQFERLPGRYFTNTLRELGTTAMCVLYSVGGKLIGFNLLLYDRGQLLDKFIGMDGVLARKHNLYFVSWLYNVRHCIERGMKLYEPGQAGYESKIRMGCRLLPNWYYFHHANPLVNAALRVLSRWMHLDRFEPMLLEAFADAT